MWPSERLSHRFSVTPVSAHRQLLESGGILRPSLGSCANVAAYRDVTRVSCHAATSSCSWKPACARIASTHEVTTVGSSSFGSWTSTPDG